LRFHSFLLWFVVCVLAENIALHHSARQLVEYRLSLNVIRCFGAFQIGRLTDKFATKGIYPSKSQKRHSLALRFFCFIADAQFLGEIL